MASKRRCKNIQYVPPEIIGVISSFWSPEERRRIRLVCKTWNYAISSWHGLLRTPEYMMGDILERYIVEGDDHIEKFEFFYANGLTIGDTIYPVFACAVANSQFKLAEWFIAQEPGNMQTILDGVYREELLLVTSGRNVRCVTWLLDHGADINYRGTLHEAFYNACVDNDVVTARWLKELGAKRKDCNVTPEGVWLLIPPNGSISVYTPS